MLRYTGFIKGSKTMDFQALTAVMIAAETNLNLVETYLGGHYGAVAFSLVLINTILRMVTKNGLGNKLFGKKDV